MRMSFWSRLALAALFAVGVGAAGTHARTLDDIIKSGTIKVGVNPTLPPLGKFNEKNEITGFDVEYAAEIAKMLGVKLEIVQVGSPDRIPFVQTGKIDFVMSAMTRTPERAKVIDFTLPVHTEVMGVLTIEGKPYKHWKDLDNEKVTLVQVRGTTPIKFIEENLKKAKVTQLDNYPDVIRALAQGRGDGMIDIIDFVGEHMNKHQVKWKVVETPVDVYYCSLGVAKNSVGLKDWLNVAIFDLHKKGKTAELWKKWFGIDMLYPTGVGPGF
ncbi:MAG: transporter substrate-binding domain-containing protein [Hyphomicrobiaceae bacterium]